VKPPTSSKEGKGNDDVKAEGEGEGDQTDEGQYGAGQVPLHGELRGQGLDYVRNDPDGKRMRLDAGVVLE
jgi:hypothetical protein